MIPKLQLVGLGNSLVDIELSIANEEFEELGFTKNSMTLIDDATRDRVLDRFKEKKMKYNSGGAVGNTVHALSKLGNKVGLMGFVGKDFHGEMYLKDLAEAGVEFLGEQLDGATGTSIIVITPDAHRTMLTTLGCASNLKQEKLESVVQSGQIDNLLVESYQLFGEKNIGIIRDLIKQAKQHGITTILSDSDAFCVEQEPEIYHELFSTVDIFYLNGEQAKAMKKLDRNDPIEVRKIVEELEKKPGRPAMLVVTDSEHGAYICREKLEYIPIVPTEVVDTNGAGDSFSAGVLDGYMRGMTVAEMGAQGARIASEVISRYGARW